MAQPTQYLEFLLSNYRSTEEVILAAVSAQAFIARGSYSFVYLLPDPTLIPVEHVAGTQKIGFVVAKPTIQNEIQEFHDVGMQKTHNLSAFETPLHKIQEQERRVNYLIERRVQSPFLVFPLYVNPLTGVKIYRYFTFGDLHLYLTKTDVKEAKEELVFEDEVKTRRLKEYLKNPEHMKAFVAQLLLAAEALHAVGLTHQHITPKNILLDFDQDGELVVGLCDFGDVAPFDQAGHVAHAQSRLGSPEDIDARKYDVYCIGKLVKRVIHDLFPKQQEFNAIILFAETLQPEDKKKPLADVVKRGVTVEEAKSDPIFGENHQQQTQFFDQLHARMQKFSQLRCNGQLIEGMPPLGDQAYIDRISYQAHLLVRVIREATFTAEVIDAVSLLNILKLQDLVVVSDNPALTEIKAQVDFLKVKHTRDWLASPEQKLAITLVDMVNNPDFATLFRSLEEKRHGTFLSLSVVFHGQKGQDRVRGLRQIFTSGQSPKQKLLKLVECLNNTAEGNWFDKSVKPRLCRALLNQLGLPFIQGREKAAWQEYRNTVEALIQQYDVLAEVVPLARACNENAAAEERAIYQRIGKN